APGTGAEAGWLAARPALNASRPIPIGERTPHPEMTSGSVTMARLADLSALGPSEDHDRVVPAERERVVLDDAQPRRARMIRNGVEAALRVGLGRMNRRRHESAAERERARNGTEGARGAHRVTEHRFDGARRRQAIAEHVTHRLRFDRVVHLRPGAV